MVAKVHSGVNEPLDTYMAKFPDLKVCLCILCLFVCVCVCVCVHACEFLMYGYTKCFI